MANLQGATVALTVLCAAPFGLFVTCFALAVRPWILLPVIAVMFRRATAVSEHKALLQSARSLVGAVLMAILVSLPFAPRTGVAGAIELGLQVLLGILFYFSYLYFFARNDLRPFLPAALSRAY